jgi:hypothetical protein
MAKKRIAKKRPWNGAAGSINDADALIYGNLMATRVWRELHCQPESPRPGAIAPGRMAFSPLTNQVLAANNAESPAFGNLFSTTNGGPPVALAVSPITVPASQGDHGRRRWPSRLVATASKNRLTHHQANGAINLLHVRPARRRA